MARALARADQAFWLYAQGFCTNFFQFFLETGSTIDCWRVEERSISLKDPRCQIFDARQNDHWTLIDDCRQFNNCPGKAKVIKLKNATNFHTKCIERKIKIRLDSNFTCGRLRFELGSCWDTVRRKRLVIAFGQPSNNLPFLFPDNCVQNVNIENPLWNHQPQIRWPLSRTFTWCEKQKIRPV